MLTVGYVHPGVISQVTHESIRRLDLTIGVHEVAVKSGPNISPARNEIVDAFLRELTDSDRLLMIDTDMKFYPEDVTELDMADRPIISGLYTGLHPNGDSFPVGSVRREGKLQKLTWEDLPKSGITPIVGCGMGMCLIKREVLETLAAQRKERQLWPFTELEIPGEQVTSEDITFCIRAETFGFQTYLDVDVPVGHYKSGVIMPLGYGEKDEL